MRHSHKPVRAILSRISASFADEANRRCVSHTQEWMHWGTHRSGLVILWTVGCLAGVAGCGDATGGRGFGATGDARQPWTPSGKADENATCQDHCGRDTPTDAGCFCDEACEVIGDCCPDYEPVCSGGGDGSAGKIIGGFELGYYFRADAGRYKDAADTTIYDAECREIDEVPEGFVDALVKEQIGLLDDDAGTIQVAGECGCDTSPCFRVLDEKEFPWGFGLDQRPTDPFRSLAADPAEIPLGTIVYIEALDGQRMPGEEPWGDFVHDGCVQVDDASNAFDDDKVGLFTGRVREYVELSEDLQDEVEIRHGGDRCRYLDPDAPEPDDEDDDKDDDDDDPPGPSPDGQVCYPGSDGDHDTCFELTSMRSEYEIPVIPGKPKPASYLDPIALIDLRDLSESEPLTSSFVLGEIGQKWKGEYAIIQRHAIEKLQDLRDDAGPITVNSGYRPPEYNSGLSGSAGYSRHMYGDAFDMKPHDVSLQGLADICKKHDAYPGWIHVYTSHVHCDWRHKPQDPAFYPSSATAAPDGNTYGIPYGPEPSPCDATIVEGSDGTLTVKHEGFEEGKPLIQWTLLDADGVVVALAEGELATVPPQADAAVVEVGMCVQVQWSREGGTATSELMFQQ